jgi:hypothetical protein
VTEVIKEILDTKESNITGNTNLSSSAEEIISTVIVAENIEKSVEISQPILIPPTEIPKPIQNNHTSISQIYGKFPSLIFHIRFSFIFLKIN